MKYLLVCAMLLSCAWAQTKYSNIDDSTLVDNGSGTGWGSCVGCAGGNNNAVIASSPFQNPPSVDGGSRDFYINGAAYSNGLWWYKVGANNNASSFSFDFWLNVNNSIQYAQASEFDVFQFNNVSGVQYMFGTQCDYASGTWDVWNAGGSPAAWVHTAIPCARFAQNVWYHITETFHRDSSNNEYYDNLTIAQYNRQHRLVSLHTYAFNEVFPAGTLPQGWGSNMGVQFQMDIGATGASMQQWVDQVSL